LGKEGEEAATKISRRQVNFSEVLGAKFPRMLDFADEVAINLLRI